MASRTLIMKGGMKYVSRNFTYFDIDFNIFENNKNFKRHNKIVTIGQSDDYLIIFKSYDTND